MKTNLFCFLLCSFGAFASQVQGAQQAVVPGGLANVEGNSSMADPFNSTSFRFQQVFDASEFSFIGNATGVISSISFRNDGGSTDRILLSFGGATVVLSTTPRGADGLSTTFADNRGADSTTVFSGGLALGTFYQPGASPQPFKNPTIQLTTPFYYIPSHGNLVLDIIAGSGQAFLPGALDAQSISGDSVSRLYANSSGALTGTADTAGLVTRFDIAVVPEPSTFWITLTGVAAMVAFGGRGRLWH